MGCIALIHGNLGVTFAIKLDPPARVARPHEAVEALLVDVAIRELLTEVMELFAHMVD